LPRSFERAKKLIDKQSLMFETLKAVSRRLQEQIWLGFRLKFQATAIADALLIGRTTAQAISVGRQFLAKPDDLIELFHFLFELYENQFLISY